jgi:hypothetical protein
MLLSLKLLFAALVLCIASQLQAATIVYRANPENEPKRIAKVKIISINKNIVVIEKDGARTSIGLGQLVEYYDSDVENGGEGIDDNTCEYSVSIHEVDMPKTGYAKSGSNKKSEVSECEIQYSIIRNKTDGVNYNVVKEPYCYITILLDNDDKNGGRSILRYGYPTERAKVSKNDGYDKAAIIKQVTALNRHTINFNNLNDLSSSKSFDSKISGANERSIKIKLTNVKERRIIAYHIEFWGKKEVAGQKDWKEVGVKVGNNWWMQHWN